LLRGIVAVRAISPSILIQTLVIDILGDRKVLYRVSDLYRDKDLETIFDEDVTADALNDSALARALDKMHEAGYQKIFSEVVLSTIAAHVVSIRSIHFDTTSMSVEGEYSEEEEDAIRVTSSYSKDKRPDLKQIVFGISSNHEGIHFFRLVLSGNQDDVTWNGQVVEKIDTIIPNEFISQVIYVSDCPMVTVDTLRKASSNGLRLISLMPVRFKLAGGFAKTAWTDEKPWIQMGKLSPGGKAAFYETKSYFSEIDGIPYRLVAVHSSALDERKQKALDKMMAVEKAEIEKAAYTGFRM
jgi:transposase